MTHRLLAAAAATLALAFTMTTTAHAEDPKPAVGDAAPAFEAKDQDGNTVSSKSLYKNGATLFFFYPKASTGG